MMLEISRAALEAIVAEAAASPEREVCGLLLGEGLCVVEARPCRNVAADPSVAFEIDPAQLIAAYRAARDGGPGVIGHYHSHPNGVAGPSTWDAANAIGDGSVWIIVGSGTASAWHSTARGQFTPLKIIASPANAGVQ